MTGYKQSGQDIQRRSTTLNRKVCVYEKPLSSVCEVGRASVDSGIVTSGYDEKEPDSTKPENQIESETLKIETGSDSIGIKFHAKSDSAESENNTNPTANSSHAASSSPGQNSLKCDIPLRPDTNRIVFQIEPDSAENEIKSEPESGRSQIKSDLKRSKIKFKPHSDRIPYQFEPDSCDSEIQFELDSEDEGGFFPSLSVVAVQRPAQLQGEGTENLVIDNPSIIQIILKVRPY